MSIFGKVTFFIGYPLALLGLITNSTQSPQHIIRTTWLPSFGIMLVFFVLLILALLENTYLFRSIPRAIYTDISHEGQHPPYFIKHFGPSLYELGFTAIGEVRRSIPMQRDRIKWIYTRQDGFVTAEVFLTRSQAGVEFDTIFGDFAMVETIFPKGTPVTIPNYQGVVVSESLEKAYQKHLEVAQEMFSSHGKPVPINSMQDYIQNSSVFTEHHNRDVLINLRRRIIIEILPFFYIVLWSLMLGALTSKLDGLSSKAEMAMALLLLPLLLVAFVPKKDRLWG